MYLIDIDVSAEIDEYPSLRFQDIRKKKTKCHGRTDGRTDNVKTVYLITNKVCGGGGGGGCIESILTLAAHAFIHKIVEQIRRVFDDNLGIIFFISP